MDLFDLTISADKPTLVRGIRQTVVLAVIMLISLSLYLAVLKWRGPAASVTTATSWDQALPFCPTWVWGYLLPYLIGPAIAGVLSRDTFAWYIRRGLVIVFVSLAIFVVLPTHTTRPPASSLPDGLTGELYRSVVMIDDPPANAAPSLHVSLTCLLALAVVRDYPRWWLAAWAGAGLTWLATLLTRQHHLIDVATGVLLAAVVTWPGKRKTWSAYKGGH
jgi:hypothetical protein